MRKLLSVPSSRLSTPGIAERYFTFLGTQYTTAEGKSKQPASGKYIDLLRELHQRQKSGIDLSACLAGTQPGFKGRVWFWSDLHFFHANIIKFCQRPFADIGRMHQAMLTNCLARVTADDILVFGGDITFGDVHATNALLRSIPAYKINILGNHDIEKRELLSLAVDEVAPCVEAVFQGVTLFFSHYPVKEQVLAPGQLNVHGHIHNSPFPPGLGSGKRHVNMCVEHTEFAPASLERLLFGDGAMQY